MGPTCLWGRGVSHIFGVCVCVCVHPSDMWDWTILVRANFVITTSVVIKRDLLFAVGPFNNKTLGDRMCSIDRMCSLFNNKTLGVTEREHKP